MKNGCNGNELNLASGFQIDSDGVIREQTGFHDYDNNGWICYTFDEVQATAIGLGFKQDCCSHIRLMEVQLRGTYQGEHEYINTSRENMYRIIL